jgi:lysozyme
MSEERRYVAAEARQVDLERGGVIDQLKRHEGLRLKPYHCPAGKLTIGYGRNLDANGITEDEAERMLAYDVNIAISHAMDYIGGSHFFAKLSDARQAVLINMAFQMGGAGLKKFKNTKRLILAAIDNGNWDAVALGMLNSKWAKQTPARAKELAEQMKSGEWK